MRGISTILATMLIVIIVVILISMTYTFVTSIFNSSTISIEDGIRLLFYFVISICVIILIIKELHK